MPLRQEDFAGRSVRAEGETWLREVQEVAISQLLLLPGDNERVGW